MKDDIKNVRIIFCGPKHSGKSELLNFTYTQLPQSYTAIVRTAPDGEGVFSRNPNQEEIQNARIKGKFTKDKNEAHIKNIENEVAPIVLVDTGGKFSEEKDAIFNSCNYCVILSNNEEDKIKWLDFANFHYVQPIAILDSSLEGKDEIYDNSDILTGKVCNLERGKVKKTSPLLDNLLTRIKEITIEKGFKRKGEEYLRDKNVINMTEIAQLLDMINEENGNAEWDISKLNEVYAFLDGALANKEEAKFFEARANFIVGMSTELAKSKNINDISYYDARQNTFNKVTKSKVNLIQKSCKLDNNLYMYDILPEDKLKMLVSQTEEDIFIDLKLNTDKKLLPEDMDEMNFPDLDSNKNLHISGKMPSWLVSNITLDYDNKNKYILQPGLGFIKYASENTKDLGELKDKIKDIDIEKIFLTYKESVIENTKKQV